MHDLFAGDGIRTVGLTAIILARWKHWDRRSFGMSIRAIPVTAGFRCGLDLCCDCFVDFESCKSVHDHSTLCVMQPFFRINHGDVTTGMS